MKKIKGTKFILDKEEKNIYTLNRNAVYHYRFPELKLLNTFKSLSNISYMVLSKDEKQIAVVNTSGTIAVHIAETGELLGESKMEKTETFFSCYLDDDWILCADWGGKIMRMNTKSFKHEVLLDLKYFEREFRPMLLLDKEKMRIVEVDDDNTAEMNIYSIPELLLEKEDYSELLECITTDMLFRENLYINFYGFVGCNDLTIFNKNQIVQRMSLPIKNRCRCYNISKNMKYVVFCDGVVFGYDTVKILDISTQEIVKSYSLEYVDFGNEDLIFIHNDKTLLIGTAKGIYVDELELT